MKRIRNFLLSLLSAAMVVNCLTASAVFAGVIPTFAVESKTAIAGTEVEVNVNIRDNPGILGATLTLTYDEGLTLSKVENGEAFSPLHLQEPGAYTSPCNFVWDGQSLPEEDIKDGSILKLTFIVDKDVLPNTNLKISASSTERGIRDTNLQVVQANFESGFITPLEFKYGDLDSDQDINIADVVLLRREIAGGYDQEVNRNAADVDLDSELTVADVIFLRQYLAGGYEIDALPVGVIAHEHTMQSVSYRAATCEEDGNIAYWYCTSCRKYFKDEKGAVETTLADTVIKSTGHDIVVIPGRASTTDVEGLTDGKQCSKCGYWEVEQQLIPKLEKGIGIKYYLGDTKDAYLATQEIINPNPDSYLSSEGLILQNIEDTIPGYTFKGWFDSFSDNAAQIKKINPGETVTQLYAHWEIQKYNITYICGDNMNPQFGDNYLGDKYASYTVNTGLTLPNIGIDKYYFVGWTDEAGNLLKSIPVGTTGNKILTANWTSYRNTAKSFELKDPKVIEDSANGKIVYAYEIGQLENVPLYTYFKLNSVNGVISKYEEKTTVQFTKQEAKDVTNAIALATTNSASWSLSKDWNNVTEIDKTSAAQHGKTVDEAKQESQTSETGYSLTSAKGGSSTVSTSSSFSSSLSGSSSHNTFSESQVDTAYQVNTGFKETSGQEVGASVKAGYGLMSAEVSAKATHETESTVNTQSNVNTHQYGSQTDNFSSGFSNSASATSASSANSSWSSSDSYSSSETTTKSSSISKALSELISSEDHYGKSIAEGGSNSENRAEEQTQHNTTSYSNQFVYGKMESKTDTKSYSSTGRTVGDYRLVQAGTVHVYGVITYDVATAAYSVSTYSVLDDQTYEYLDYSTDGTFTDYEYGVIPFEVPVNVFNYVEGKILKTFDEETGKGLHINDKGIVTSYDGTDEYVLIPSYDRQYNTTSGEYESVKVVGIAEGVFANNTTIKGVSLSYFMDSISDGAFMGCTGLEEIVCPRLNNIGSNAFSGCKKLNKFTVSRFIDSIGAKAFEGVNEIVVNAKNKEISMQAAASGALNITFNLNSVDSEELMADEYKLVIPDTVNKAVVNGAGKTFTDLTISSDAAITQIGNIVFNQENGVPLRLSSGNIILEKVTIQSSGYAMLLSEEATLKVIGTNIVRSLSNNAIVCNNLTIDSTTNDAFNVTGNIYYYGKLPEGAALKLLEGERISLTAEQFEKYIQGMFTLSFDANGGEVAEESKICYIGSQVGVLPNPTRTGYAFDGWYTAASGGEKITETSILNTTSNMTVYAQWKPNSYMLTFNANGGSCSTSSKTIEYDAVYGTLPVPTKTGYGFTGWFTEKTGGIQVTADTKLIYAENQTVYAQWKANSYTLTFNANGGSCETSSKTIEYDAAYGTLPAPTRTGYSFSGWFTAKSGGNKVTKDTKLTSASNQTVYAQWSANDYTYNVSYVSTNGTNLGGTTVTGTFGASKTITAPAKTGYTTPSSQTVTWDKTSKTITFEYAPSSVSSTQKITSGTWWNVDNSAGITYSVSIETRNRTSTSIQARVVWTQSIKNACYGQKQYFNGSIGGVGIGDVTIKEASKWWSGSSTTYYNDSLTVYSGWVTISVSATSTSLSASGTWWDAWRDGSWNGSFSISTY